MENTNEYNRKINRRVYPAVPYTSISLFEKGGLSPEGARGIYILKSIFLLSFIIFHSSLVIYSQSPEWIIYDKSNITEIDIDHNNVSFIAIDSVNNKWTWYSNVGITTFDGTHWSAFDEVYVGTTKRHTLSLRDIEFNHNNAIWFVAGRIFKMIPGVDTTFIFQPSERLDTTLYFYPISITSDGNYLWIGSGDSGIVRYEDNESEFTYYNVQSGHLPTNYTYKIELDDSGYFWLATDSGLVKWDGDSILQIWNTSNSQMPGNEFFDLDFDKQGNIWVAFSPTWSNDTIDLSCKIGKFDGSNWTIYDTTNSGLPKNLSDDFIDLALPSSIAIDNFNNKWIGTFKGLFRYDDSTWTTYNIPGSDTNANKNLIQDVAIDSLGNIWLGTFEGLVCFNENGIVTATDKKDEGDLNPMTTFFPNPSDKTVKVKYNVEKPGQVHCEVYDSGGRFIGKYINKYTEAGEQEAIINTSGFAPGVYMFKMKIGNRTEVKKVVVK